MHYKDLSPYDYLSLNPCEELAFFYSPIMDTVVNIGWLDKDEPFRTGQVPVHTVENFLKLCFWPVNICRGAHFCNLCDYDEPPLIEWEGKRSRLGAAEIWVPGKNRIVYAAPDLLYHYIRDHSYRPPDEFISAVDEMVAGGSASKLV